MGKEILTLRDIESETNKFRSYNSLFRRCKYQKRISI